MSHKPQDPVSPDSTLESQAAAPHTPRQTKMTPELVDALFDRLSQRVNERLKHIDEPDV